MGGGGIASSYDVYIMQNYSCSTGDLAGTLYFMSQNLSRVPEYAIQWLQSKSQDKYYIPVRNPFLETEEEGEEIYVAVTN